MAGISDKALEKLDSKNKFDGGVNFEEDYGVNLYSTFFRNYDPQIGRFDGVDVLSERTFGMSVYGFSDNNPIYFNDPTGSTKTLPTINEIINALDESSDYGGFWSASDPFRVYGYGDDATAQFLSSGGSSGFLDNLASAYNFIQKQQAAGNEVVTFDISQGSNGDYYATAGYYGGGGLEKHESATMIKDLGQLSPGMNGLNYSWGDIVDNSSQTNENWTLGTGIKAGVVLGVTSNLADNADLAFDLIKSDNTAVKSIGFGVSAISTSLSFAKVTEQYHDGGLSNVDPSDATGFVLGATGLTSSTLSYLNVAPNTTGLVSEFAGNGALALGAYQNWMMMFQTIYNTNLPNSPMYGSGNASDQFYGALAEQAQGGDQWQGP